MLQRYVNFMTALTWPASTKAWYRRHPRFTAIYVTLGWAFNIWWAYRILSKPRRPIIPDGGYIQGITALPSVNDNRVVDVDTSWCCDACILGFNCAHAHNVHYNPVF